MGVGGSACLLLKRSVAFYKGFLKDARWLAGRGPLPWQEAIRMEEGG